MIIPRLVSFLGSRSRPSMPSLGLLVGPASNFVIDVGQLLTSDVKSAGLKQGLMSELIDDGAWQNEQVLAPARAQPPRRYPVLTPPTLPLCPSALTSLPPRHGTSSTASCLTTPFSSCPSTVCVGRRMCVCWRPSRPLATSYAWVRTTRTTLRRWRRCVLETR